MAEAGWGAKVSVQRRVVKAVGTERPDPKGWGRGIGEPFPGIGVERKEELEDGDDENSVESFNDPGTGGWV